MQCMTQLAVMSRIRGKPANLSLLTTIVHFQQCMYQGQWTGDSPLKQLPYFNDRVGIKTKVNMMMRRNEK